MQMMIAVINGRGEVHVCDDIHAAIPKWRDPSPEEVTTLEGPAHDLTPMITEACNATLATIFDTWND